MCCVTKATTIQFINDKCDIKSTQSLYHTILYHWLLRPLRVDTHTHNNVTDKSNFKKLAYTRFKGGCNPDTIYNKNKKALKFKKEVGIAIKSKETSS